MYPRKLWFGLSTTSHLAAGLLGVGLPVLIFGAYRLQSRDIQPPARIPSYIAWTDATLAAASKGNAFHGLVIATRCDHCHGREGFSAEASMPNLAGMDKLAMWKQLNDFNSGKRTSATMQPIAAALSTQDYADLAAYYSMLPTSPDRFDARSFPQQLPTSTDLAVAARLISGGDGQRGIPPCQACHGPIGFKLGAPSLITQNSTYILEELEEFSHGNRTNDINMPMRSIASLLTDDEKQAVAAYYGAGLASLPVGATVGAK